MQGNYKVVDVLLKIAVPTFYDNGDTLCKTTGSIYRKLKDDNYMKVISVDLCPDNTIPEYGVFQFELGLDIGEVINDLPKEKQEAITKYIENYIPRR